MTTLDSMLPHISARFASKTLMRILPAEKRSEVEKLIETKAMTLDLYEILGQCTWSTPA